MEQKKIQIESEKIKWNYNAFHSVINDEASDSWKQMIKY